LERVITLKLGMIMNTEISKRIRVNGIELAVRDQGNGSPALMFLHYWGGSSRTWQMVTGQLASTFRCISYDQRGWGESDSPADGYGLTEMGADAEELIRAFDLKSYVLVGHSMGGKVAQLLASRRPPGLRGLVLVAPASPAPQDIPEPGREAQLHAYDNRDTVLQAIAFLTHKPLNEKLRSHVIEDSLRGSKPAKLAWPTSGAYKDISDEVRKIAVPTLVLAGDHDRQDPLEQQQREVLARIPASTLLVVKDSGHLSPLEQPNQLAEAIAAFALGLER
jgi:pimeloyl-ACP methyl ester carboxylesterase